jgi:cobalamin-dependent methionine synthase I
MVGLIGKMFDRQGKMLTKHRYSPGFGDLPLNYQKDIFSVLELEKFNMSITEKFMLIPEKSVIAIAGIEKRGV